MSVTYQVRDRIAFIAIASPPVNALSHAVRVGLVEAFDRARTDASVDGVVLHGEGPCFSAGGDIKEFGTAAESASPGLSAHVHPAIEACRKPVVAAIHAYALGGGFETALVCHRRVAARGAKLGLPEARINVVPLSGTQRLPRLAGLALAVEMITSGAAVEATTGCPLVDAVVDEHLLLQAAVEAARLPAPALLRDRPFPTENAGAILAAARQRQAAGALPPFALFLLDAIAAGADAASFDAGLNAARVIYKASLDGRAARAAFRDRAKEPR